MTQKNSENIYKALKEEERTLLEKNVTWMEKAFKRKEGYVTFGNQLFTKIGEKYGIVCISAAGKDNIKQRIFPMKSEKVLVIADGAAFGPQMNDIYAYDPDTEEEAGQCVDEVIQIAEESGAEIQFY